jgi:metal-dependent HD superfamily phosphatase/phosphodiesterase
MNPIINKSKKSFFEYIHEAGSDPFTLKSHVIEVEKWAKKILKTHPEADEEVVILGVFLHDFGHYPINPAEDHAITGEKKAKALLEKEGFDKEKTKQVLHCIRSHRCKDVMPTTIEAKILACADSASHFTSTMYFDILQRQKNENTTYSAFDKLERDYRDLTFFPEIKKELTPLYEAWLKLLKEYEKIEY